MIVNPQVLTRSQVRSFDQISIEQFHLHSLVLMENAARGAVDVLCETASHGSAVILCGPGNNGGDGLVMARHLHLRDWQVKVILVAEASKISQDAAANLRILRQTQVPVSELQSPDLTLWQQELGGFEWIVDALLGTGARPPIRSPMREAVQAANQMSARRMAVDLPSGLDCDTDQADGEVFNAHVTVSFVALKPVMLTDTGKRHCGETRIVDIGAPPEVFDVIGGG